VALGLTSFAAYIIGLLIGLHYGIKWGYDSGRRAVVNQLQAAISASKEKK
jgi:hypothetical protein